MLGQAEGFRKYQHAGARGGAGLEEQLALHRQAIGLVGQRLLHHDVHLL